MQFALVVAGPGGHWFLRQDVDFQLGPASPVTQEFSTAKRAYFVSRGAGLSGYVAELSSAILGAELGLPVAHLDNHASYVEHWLKLLRDDDRAILTAAAKAEEAATLLLRLGGRAPAEVSDLDDNASAAALAA